MESQPRPTLKTDPAPRAIRTASLRRAQWHCLRRSLGHYENFFVLGPLTPPRLAPHLAALYAFCRHSDDLADEIRSRPEARQKLDDWEQELRRSLAGKPDHPIMQALAHTVRVFSLPSQPLFDLLSAFRQDLAVNRYDTFRELRDYTRRSADPVGRLVLRLHGYDNAELDAISDFVCTGLQLANFCQDIAGDAERDRVYIPLDECRRFDVSPAEILSRQPRPEFERLIRFQIVRAYKLLQAGAHLPERLSGRLRYAVRLFVYGGMQVLDNLQRDPLQALQRRIKVTPQQKFSALLRCLRPLIPSRDRTTTPES